jgi:hypothetical protein
MRYYLRNQKRKIKTFRICGKNVRRRNCEKGVEEYFRRVKKGVLESQEEGG